MADKPSAAEAGTGYRAFTIPGAQHRVLLSRDKGREYRIFVWKPEEQPPPSGYPVIYALDANAVFGTMVEALRLQSRRPEKTGVVPAVIVGIGYETDAPFSPQRFYDYTLSEPDAEVPRKPDGAAYLEQGGAEAFVRFIEEDLKPVIEREYRIDSGRQTIFGHSLGGLFVLHMLFTRPAAFQTYVAGSPSIHWNKRFILAEERQFTTRLQKEKVDAGLLLTVGELEKHHQSRMNLNARELSNRLSVHENSGLRVVFKEFADEGHISVLPVLISKALRFALHPNGPNRW